MSNEWNEPKNGVSQEQTKTTEKTTEEGFMDKVKNGFMKFIKGVKNFFKKTAIRNGKNYYGMINGIGELAVYDDHALIFAVGMDDIVFTKENVIGYGFRGLGPIRGKKATIEYAIVLDDNVMFPELVRQKNDVNNVIATIMIDKERSHLLGHGDVEYGSGNRLSPLEKCDVYEYPDCFVIVLNLERRNGDKVEKYQESLLYPFSEVAYINKGGSRTDVRFKDGKSLYFDAVSAKMDEIVKKIKEKM